MSRGDTHSVPMRREAMKYGGTIVGGGLFAGCTGNGGVGDSGESDNEENSADAGESYTVSTEPVGEVETERITPMEEHPVESELTAVQEGRIYPGGTAEQGPIYNLFQTELAAQQLYPDTYDGEELFDRERVADIINGEI